jgi:hypothetical protein
LPGRRLGAGEQAELNFDLARDLCHRAGSRFLGKGGLHAVEHEAPAYLATVGALVKVAWAACFWVKGICSCPGGAGL